MIYYERIRDLRDDKGISQTIVANVLNVGQRTYSDYETGRTRIPIECMIRLAAYYNVSMDYICGVTSEMREFPKK